MTKKTMSTISYNSEEFLVNVLEKLVMAHFLQAYCYICHKGEDGDKDHIHLILYPNRSIDYMDISEQLREPDITRIDGKCLGVRPWREVKNESDWFLYALHDKEYLKLKYGDGEPHEKIPYAIADLKASEDFDINVAVVRAKSTMLHTSSNMAKRIISGTSPLELILSGENVHTVNAIKHALIFYKYKD